MPISTEEVARYYDESNKLQFNPNGEVTIDSLNSALSNWHVISSYLGSMQKAADTEKNILEFNYESFKNSIYRKCYDLVKSEIKSAPTTSLVESKMQEIHSNELHTHKMQCLEAETVCDHIRHLRQTHEKFASVLATLSSNMRTDWVYANGRAVKESQDMDELKSSLK